MYTFPNKKRYIGKTKRSLARRQGKDWEHYKNSRLLWNAIQKYGIDNIETDILFEGMITDDEANELEVHYIEAYKTNANKYKHPCYGYNLTAGGEGVVDWEPTPERREFLQKQMYELSQKRRGVKFTEEHKKKLSDARKGRTFGPRSEETKRKISIANSRENMTEETKQRRKMAGRKPVMATNKKTGDSLWFDSATATAEYFGVAISVVCRWINGTRNPSNNYKFEYCPRTTTEEVGSANAEYVTV